jgi:hypothetical protein
MEVGKKKEREIVYPCPTSPGISAGGKGAHPFLEHKFRQDLTPALINPGIYARLQRDLY